MSLCEICGKDSFLLKTKIEGAVLQLCKSCGAGGQVLDNRSFNNFNKKRGFRSQRRDQEDTRSIVSDYAKRLQAARNKQGMSQEDFAKSLNERLSTVQKWESGQMKPWLSVAKKLERLLGISLIEKKDDGADVSNEETKTSSSKSVKARKAADGFTLGDFIKVRNRKK